MRIKSLAIALALVLVIGLVGCESNPGGANGKLIVRISADAKAKGISPIGMDVDHYSINLTSEGRDPINQDGVTSGYFSFEIPPATWNIVVTAYNNDGISIGEGCGSCAVRSGATSECEILVEEYTGKGNLNLVAEVSGGGVLRIEILDARDNVVASGNLASGSNIFQLDSGFYLLKIADGSGEILFMETFRICAGHDTNVPVSVLTDSEGAVHITNGIQNTPDIILSMKSILSFGEEYTVEAQIENLSDPVFKWYLDNVLVEGADLSVYAGAVPAKDGIAEGTHTITCVASSGDVVWSAEKQFSVLEKTFEGTWWVTSKPEAYFKENFKIDMHDGHMVFDRYIDHRADLGLESDYMVTKIGSDYKIDFNWYHRPYHFVVYNGDLENAELFYYPEDDSGTAVTFKGFVSGPEWMDGYAERDSEHHAQTISNPELGTFEVSGTTEVHQFDENGICEKCGYDSTKHLYEVNSDFSVVDESVDYLNVRRYWPGMLALGDGTVVDGSDSFYIKKEGSSVGNGNCYILYVPHTIVDFYVQNGGGGGEWLQPNAFKWYVEQALGRECDFGNCGPYNEMLQDLFASGNQIDSLDADTIPNERKRKVSNDVSLLTSNRTGLSCLSPFTLNDVEFEDGSPVTASEAFYFQLAEHDGGVYLFYPESIKQEYEKGQGVNPESGNPFWWYLYTYHPEIEVADRYSIETLKQLVSSEFIQPSYLDIGTFRH